MVLLMNEQDFAKKFSKAMICWRDRLDMEPEAFARFLGISKNTVYNYESGRCMPMLYTAMLIAEKLGTTVDGLLRGD